MCAKQRYDSLFGFRHVSVRHVRQFAQQALMACGAIGLPFVARTSNSSFFSPAVPITVLEGMDVVMKIEGKGSGSGRPSATITVADSGELK
jgi:hypothetical protein